MKTNPTVYLRIMLAVLVMACCSVALDARADASYA